MSRGITVLPLGTVVGFGPKSDALEGVIRGIFIDENGVNYPVHYWDGRTKMAVEFLPSELRYSGDGVNVPVELFGFSP